MTSGACKRDDRSFGVPTKEKWDKLKGAFRSIWRMWSLFSGWIDALGRPLVSAIRISQVVAFSRTLSVHLNPRIEGTETVCGRKDRFDCTYTYTGTRCWVPSTPIQPTARCIWLLCSRKFSSAKNFVNSDRQSVRQFVRNSFSSNVGCHLFALRSFWLSLLCLSFIFTFMNLSYPTTYGCVEKFRQEFNLVQILLWRKWRN